MEENDRYLKQNLQDDIFEHLFKQYGLLLCQVGILLVAFIPPTNILSLVYILYFQVFLYLNFKYGCARMVAAAIFGSLRYLIWLSIMILVVRYIYTINYVNYFV
jgi:hypothetical protein